MNHQIITAGKLAIAIRYLRGQKVLLDRDLAALYGVTTKALNQAVRRNPERFPRDFVFQLTAAETESLRSQFVTLKRGEHRKYPPLAFTEQGIAMLSNVLKSERAVKVNIASMRAFVQLSMRSRPTRRSLRSFLNSSSASENTTKRSQPSLTPFVNSWLGRKKRSARLFSPSARKRRVTGQN